MRPKLIVILSPNANHHTSNSSDSITRKKIDSIEQQLNQLNSLIRTNLPQPDQKANPNKNHVSLTYRKPERGMNKITVDVNEMGNILIRVKNVTYGTSIDPKLQGVITSMNSETNKALCKKLDGMYIPSCLRILECRLPQASFTECVHILCVFVS